MTDEEFEAVRDYLAAQAGLVFDDTRRPGLSATVSERARATGHATPMAYLRWVKDRRGEAERQRLLDEVTVQETYFFRNPPQIEALRRRVLPELVRRAAGRTRPLTVWSAGCSTGEEAYTLAMLLLEVAPMLGYRAPARVLGTDVSAAALDTARRGVYAGRAVQGTPPTARERWFEPVGGGALAVRDEVRRLVDLQVHNLVTDPPPFAAGEVDLVVCRNVTIYFSRDTTRALVGRFHDVLAEGGYLLLGHSETLWQVSDAFSLVPVGDAFVYRLGQDPSRPRRSVPQPRGALPRRPRRPQPVRAADAPDQHASLGDAAAALDAGRYDEAVTTAQRVVTAYPLRADGYLVLGRALSTLGRDGEALDPLRKAVYLDPAAGHAHFVLASSLARLGQHAAAAAAYRAAAATLGSVDRSALASVLDGRDVAELVDLCSRLADISAELDRGERRLAAGRSGS